MYADYRMRKMWARYKSEIYIVNIDFITNPVQQYVGHYWKSRL